MQFTAPLISAFALLAATQVLGAAVELPRDVAGILVATDPYYACNCPNNCSYKEGSGCRFYSGPSDNSRILKGKCHRKDGKLTCVP
ncbi:hypothetical protein V494_01379 [Pseudogymnoascus sp. VKM F-4513 (FW-928)]|nr:hypothetical protein V494_01379 [Pseudogymnoascus sp. VKM F-4513 (FW-928)]